MYFFIGKMAKKRNLTKYDPARDAMMLIEYARCRRPAVVAKQYGVHHSYVQRLWQALTEEEKRAYEMKADDVRDIAAEKIVAIQADAITEITNEITDLAMLSLREYGRRLRDEQLKRAIKDKDLISFISKSVAIINGNTKDEDNDDDDKKKPLSQVFNMFEQSMMEHLTITEYEYENE